MNDEKIRVMLKILMNGWIKRSWWMDEWTDHDEWMNEQIMMNGWMNRSWWIDEWIDHDEWMN